MSRHFLGSYGLHGEGSNLLEGIQGGSLEGVVPLIGCLCLASCLCSLCSCCLCRVCLADVACGLVLAGVALAVPYVPCGRCVRHVSGDVGLVPRIC